MAFRFRNFKVYHDAMKLHIKIVGLTKNFPRDYDYLTNQIKRSSLSPVLNLAEGSAKTSDKDFNRYVENSLGSISETVAGLEVALNLGLINQETFNLLEKECQEIANQLGGLSKFLKIDSKK